MLLCLLPWLAGVASAAGFAVEHAATRLVEENYRLDARIAYRFGPEVLEALNKGVPLILHQEIEIRRKRDWWTDKTVRRLHRHFQLTYHAFADQYLLRNLDDSALSIHPALAQALAELGSIDGLPLLAADRLQDGTDYRVRLRTYLDIEALPAPLRPVAYVSPAWRLASEWYTCALQP